MNNPADIAEQLPADIRKLRFELRNGDEQLIAPAAQIIARFDIDPDEFVRALSAGLVPAVMRPRGGWVWEALAERFRDEYGL